MGEELKITILPGGKIIVDASGFKGKTCQVEQEELEKFLQKSGYTVSNKNQKKKFEQMYDRAPGETVSR